MLPKGSKSGELEYSLTQALKHERRSLIDMLSMNMLFIVTMLIIHSDVYKQAELEQPLFYTTAEIQIILQPRVLACGLQVVSAVALASFDINEKLERTKIDCVGRWPRMHYKDVYGTRSPTYPTLEELDSDGRDKPSCCQQHRQANGIIVTTHRQSNLCFYVKDPPVVH